MKKFIVSLALALSLSSMQGWNPFVTDLQPGEAAKNYFDSLSAELKTTNILPMRAFILCKHAPICSLLGGTYGGLVGYAFVTQIERLLKHRSPEQLAKVHPKIRQLIKILTTGSFAVLGAWLAARSYQNWTAADVPLAS